MRIRLIALFVGLLVSTNGVAQQVEYLDLSDVDQPTDPAPHGTRIENFTCGGTDEGMFAHRVKVSLEWIQSDDIYPQERLGMEVRVENVGPSSITLPMHPNLTELQPLDLAKRFEYYSLRLPLEASVSGSGLLVGWFELYGSPSQPNTLLVLKSGESIRVRGQIIVQRSYERDQSATLKTDFWLSKNVFPAEENKDNTVGPTLDECILPVEGRSMIAQMHPY